MQVRRWRCSSDEEVRVAATLVEPRYLYHYWQPLLDAVTPGGGQVVLNLRCGTGELARQLLARVGGGRVVAIDDDDGMLEYARRVALGTQPARVFYKREDVTRLSFGNEAFDVVVGALGDSPFGEPASVLSELHRILRRGGRVVLTFAASSSHPSLLDMLSEVATAEADPDLRGRIEAWPGRLETQWTEAARDAGFQHVQVREDAFPLSFGRARDIATDELVGATLWPKLRALASDDPSQGDKRVRDAVERLGVYLAGPISLDIRVASLVLSR